MLHSVKQYCRAVKGKITVSADFYILLALAVVLVPLQWVGAWILALSIHELCHYIALRICGGNVTGIRIGCKGVLMETQPLTLGKEAICAYAGPVGALLVLLFARYIPRTAICTLVLSAYNLLPVFPLDGGRGLGCLLKWFLPENLAKRLLGYVENGVLFGIFAIAIYSVVQLGLGLLPSVVAALVFWRSKGIKFPCKKCQLGLQ